MIRLGDLDANLVILALLEESKNLSDRAEPGAKNFDHYMAASRVVGSLAIALHMAFKAAVNPEHHNED